MTTSNDTATPEILCEGALAHQLQQALAIVRHINWSESNVLGQEDRHYALCAVEDLISHMVNKLEAAEQGELAIETARNKESAQQI